MAPHPLDRDRDSFDLGAAFREFCTLGLCAGFAFGLLVFAHGVVS